MNEKDFERKRLQILNKRMNKWKKYYKAINFIKQNDGLSSNYIDLLQKKLKISLEETKQIIYSLVRNNKIKIVNDSIVPIIKCAICGKELELFDQGNNISNGFNYGSKYDGMFIDIDLCTDCYDNIIDKILPLFPNNPIKDYDEVRKFEYNNEPY